MEVGIPFPTLGVSGLGEGGRLQMTAKQASRNAIAILVSFRMILVASLQNEALYRGLRGSL